MPDRIRRIRKLNLAIDKEVLSRLSFPLSTNVDRKDVHQV